MRKIGLFCVAALLVACNEDKLTNILSDASNYFAVRMTPMAVSMAVGQSQQMTMTAYDGSGCNALCTQLVPGNPITVAGTPTYRSLDTTKVRVSASGVVTAFGTGSTSVIGSLQDIPGHSGAPSVTLSDTTIFTITAAPVATLGGMTLTSNRATAGVASTDTLTVTYTDAAGVTIGTQRAATTTGIGASVGRPQFYSSNTAVATVGTTGIITGVEPGTAQISATITIGGVTKAATFNVTITDPITGTFNIQQAISGIDYVFFPGTLTVSATEAIVEGKAGAVVTWAVPNTSAIPGFTATSTPNSTTCFNVTFANPGAALAVGTGASGNLGLMCNGATQSRLFTTPGTYTFTNSTNGASGTLIVK